MKSILVLFLSIGLVLSESIQFPTSSSSSSSSSAIERESASPPSSNPVTGDHEESEQVPAFVIAEPSSSSSSLSQSTQSSPNTSSSSADDDNETEPQVNPMTASFLLNLALNNMAATMSYPPGGQQFRPRSSPDCPCGCKCGHGSRGVLCSFCADRGWGRGSPCPCANRGESSPMSTDRLAQAGSYYYPVYYDPATGVVLPGQERAHQMINPWTPIAQATYSRPTYAPPPLVRPVPRYVYSPQYYYYPVTPSSAMTPPLSTTIALSASYPIASYMYPPVSYPSPYMSAAASNPVYAHATTPTAAVIAPVIATRPSMSAPLVISRRSLYSPYASSPAYYYGSSSYAVIPQSTYSSSRSSTAYSAGFY